MSLVWWKQAPGMASNKTTQNNGGKAFQIGSGTGDTGADRQHRPKQCGERLRNRRQRCPAADRQHVQRQRRIGLRLV